MSTEISPTNTEVRAVREGWTHTPWCQRRSLGGKTNKQALISLERAGPPFLLSQAPKPKQLLFIIPQKSIKGMENVGACGVWMHT